MAVSAVATSTLLQFLLGGGFLTGVVSALIAIFKLRPDVNSAAVVQAEGAMSVMKEAIGRIQQERDYWQKRCEDCEQRQRRHDSD